MFFLQPYYNYVFIHIYCFNLKLLLYTFLLAHHLRLILLSPYLLSFKVLNKQDILYAITFFCLLFTLLYLLTYTYCIGEETTSPPLLHRSEKLNAFRSYPLFINYFLSILYISFLFHQSKLLYKSRN